MQKLKYLFYIILVFSIAGCCYIFENKDSILKKIDNTIEKISIGMAKQGVMNQIGKPDVENTFQADEEIWEFALEDTKNNEVTYPSNLTELFAGYYEVWTYDYPIAAKESAGLHLFFNKEGILVGFSIKKKHKPPRWDEIIARKKNALPARR